jgi:hypothetical protein
MENPPLSFPGSTGCELYLTVSTLIERKKLKKYPGLDQAFRDTREDKENRRTIEEAIKPMFDDIADRERHIFFDEHLIDAASKPDQVTLVIPQTIKWFTEKQPWQFDAGACWELAGVTCRYFWFIHSNKDISYHISLHIPYKHDARHYYALSLLQKLFFPSEKPGSDCIEQSFCLDVRNSRDQQTASKENLALFLKRKFGEHVNTILPGPSEPWWENLACEDASDSNPFLFSPEFSRAAFLLKDDFFDKTLRDPRQALAGLANHSSRVASKSSTAHEATVEPDSHPVVYNDVDIQGISAAALALIFLSGFLQNIIDFLEQDELEYNDAIEPLYPEGKMQKDPHFLLYATEDSIFEIVASSRSMEKGKAHIGICPYLFLVHVTVFHDEFLVRRFEKSVRKLTKKIGRKTRKFSSFSNSDIGQLEEIVSIFHKGRLKIFGEVERYLHIRTFLYSTEQAFYKAISDYRYIEGRLNHWNELLNELSSTASGGHELARQKAERRINRILFYIASFSVFQVLFAISQSISRWKFQDTDYEFAANALDAYFIGAAVLLAIWALAKRNAYRWSKKK